MKRKTLVAFLLAAIALVCVLALVACNGDPSESEEPSETEAPADTSDTNETEAPTDESSSESESTTEETVPEETECPHEETEEIPAVPAECDKSGKTAGTKCSACGQVLVAQDIVAKLGHSYGADNKCTAEGCDEVLTLSEGLAFEKIEGQEAYAVIGIGEFTGEDIAIPPTYNSLPVVAISQGAFKPAEGAESIIKNVIVAHGIVTIGDSAFENCTKLKNVILLNSVTTVGNNAFAGCTALNKLTLSTALETIGNNAFKGCAALTSVTLPDAVTSIGTAAFEGCSRLASFTVGEANTAYAAQSGILYNKAFTQLIHIPKNVAGDVIIPEGISAIGDSVFAACNQLKSITIANSVQTIGEKAFSNCINLEKITLGTGITSIGSNAFAGCNKLAGVYVSEIDFWFGISFANRFANPVSYSQKLYVGESLLSALTVPAGVTEIKNWAFIHCEDIVTLTIPVGVKTIGENAFYGCDSLLSVVIPEGVEALGKRAFYDCDVLAEITLPSTLKSIGVEAFKGCSELAKITFNGADTAWAAVTKGSNWDYGTKKYTLVFAPAA